MLNSGNSGNLSMHLLVLLVLISVLSVAVSFSHRGLPSVRSHTSRFAKNTYYTQRLFLAASPDAYKDGANKDGAIGSTPAALTRLEKMKGSDLKALLKSMGGKPGVKKKAELVQECHKLLLTKFDDHTNKKQSGQSDGQARFEPAITAVTKKEESQFQSQSRSRARNDNSSPSPININDSYKLSSNNTKEKYKGGGFNTNKPVRNLRPLDYDSSFRGPTSSARSSLMDPVPDKDTEGKSLLSSQNKFKHPYGQHRDNRFGEETSTADIDITFLGTASCVPSISRGVSCMALRLQSDVWLFDCGESTQLQMQKSRVKPSRIKKIFLTHAHGDHSFGLPGVLCLIGQSTQEERELAKLASKGNLGNFEAPEPIDIYGPEGTRDLVRATIQLTYSRVVAPFRVHELKNVPYLHDKCVKWRPPQPSVRTRFDPYYGEQEGGLDIYPDEDGAYSLIVARNQGSGGTSTSSSNSSSGNGSGSDNGNSGAKQGKERDRRAESNDDGPTIPQLMSVKAAPMQHTVPCVGYVIKESERPGRLRFDNVRELVEAHKDELKEQLGLRDANKVYAVLKNMKPDQGPFVFPDGTELHTRDFLEPPRPGRKIVIMGDTCEGKHIAPLAQDCDLLVHEATNAYFPDTDGDGGSGFNIGPKSTYQRVERDTFKHGHSTPQMAGAFAASVSARRLILSHFSPRYRGDDDLPHMKVMWSIEDMARRQNVHSGGLLGGGNDVVAAWDQLCVSVRLREAKAVGGEEGERKGEE